MVECVCTRHWWLSIRLTATTQVWAVRAFGRWVDAEFRADPRGPSNKAGASLRGARWFGSDRHRHCTPAQQSNVIERENTDRSSTIQASQRT